MIIMGFFDKLFGQEEADTFEHDLATTDGCHDEEYEAEC